MKNRILIFIVLTISLQVNIFSQPPSDVSEFNSNGIKVIVKTSKSPLISVIAGFEGGMIDGLNNNPEISSFVSELITESGSNKFPKDQLRSFLSKTSTSIRGDGGQRGVTFTMNCTKQHFDNSWDLFSSLILNPNFDSVEFSNILKRRINNVNSRWSRPEPLANLIADSLIKLNHLILPKRSYEKDVRACTISEMSNYYKMISERSRLIVVIVGNVTITDIELKIKGFSSMQLGSYKGSNVLPIQFPNDSKVEMVDKPLPTTYIQCMFVGPDITDKDAWALRVGSNYFREVLFREVRTKRNLSYAPGAGVQIALGKLIGTMSVSTINPDSSISVMKTELNNLKNGNFDETEFSYSKNVYSTSFFMSQMTNSSVANTIYSAQRSFGDWKYAFSFNLINSVTKADVVRAYSKYANNFQVGIVGKTQIISKEKFLIK